MDLTDSIAPRSDQMNYDDMVTGPRTVTVAHVKAGNTEQPVEIHLVEHPGRPFKPSKTVRRILVAAWGKDSDLYAGRRMTLYGDPAVRFGGKEVGGIRVSHLSHLDKPLRLPVTVTRGQKALATVQPLPDAAQATPANPMKELVAALDRAGVGREDYLSRCVGIVGRDLSSASDLTAGEVAQVIAALEDEPTQAELTGDEQ